MYQYHLVFGSTRIILFESQFQFLTEEASLRHYEKGLARGLFTFNRARIDLVWSEFGLWGLIGRICPVELVRVLCAFGCEIERSHSQVVSSILSKSFLPVSYAVLVPQSEQAIVREIYSHRLDQRSVEAFSLFLEADNQIVIGSYYTTLIHDVDSQLPKFCSLLEKDECLPFETIRKSLFELFWRGYKVVALDEGRQITLAYRNLQTERLKGLGYEKSLFYVGYEGS